MRKVSFATTISTAAGSPAGAFLSNATGLFPEQVDDALCKGALLLRRRGRPGQRLRDAAELLKRGDRLEFHYDEALLARVAPDALLVSDEGRYSIWHKPAGLLTQGTRYGDHCSLLRQVERRAGPSRRAYPVHRVDRETAGLVLIAHDRESAAACSALFRGAAVRKEYRAELRGCPAPEGTQRVITLPLDGKQAVTRLRVLSFDTGRNVSFAALLTETGRFHQIRRHCALIGTPVMGDPRYGNGNKNREGLRLEACSLAFTCPVSGKQRSYRHSSLFPSTSSVSGLRCDD